MLTSTTKFGTVRDLGPREEGGETMLGHEELEPKWYWTQFNVQSPTPPSPIRAPQHFIYPMTGGRGVPEGGEVEGGGRAVRGIKLPCLARSSA